MTNLPEKQQEAWIGMAITKNNLVEDLKLAELDMQNILTNPPDLPSALATYRKKHSDMVEKRKAFTSRITSGIIEPLMEYEKRCDPKNNEEYKKLEKKELEHRQIEAAKIKAINAKNEEKAAFKAHVINEYHRITAKLKNDIGRELCKQYEFHLRENVSVDFGTIQNMLDAVKPDPIIKFTAAHLSNEEMLEIFNTIAKPNYKEVYNSFDIEAHFANFESDRKNAEAAIKNAQDQQRLQEIESERVLKTETSLTNIIAASEVATVAAPVIKQEMKIVAVDSEQWAKTVMSAFMVNLPNLQKYIRVKRWGALSIDQMGDYLAKYVTETDNKIIGLQFEKIQK